MASPAAVLSVLVQAKGIQQTNKQLDGLQTNGLKTAKATEQMASRHRSAFSSIAKKAVGMGVATVGAYASIAGAKNAINATEDLAKTTLMLSKNFGLTTHRASEWAAVAKSRGIDGKQLTMGFKGLSTAIRGAGQGSKAQTKAFDELGISSKTLKEHGNDLDFILGKVSDGLGKLPAGTNRSAIQAKLFGKSWQTLSPLLRSGSGELNTQLKTADKYGATFSNKGAKGLEDMIKAQRESKLATLGLQVAFGTQLAPALTKIISGTASFVKGLRDGTGAGGAVRGVFVQLFEVIKGGVVTVSSIVGWFEKHKTVTMALAAAAGVLFAAYAGFTVFYLAQAAVAALRLGMLALNASFLTNPVFLVIAAIAALVAGIVVAYRESETFRKIVDGAWTVIKAVAGWLITAGVAAFNAVSGAVTVAWGAIKTATETVWGAIKTVLTTVWGVIKTLVTAYFDGYKAVITAVWGAVHLVTTTTWGLIKGVLVGVWGAIKTVATTVFGALKTVIVGEWNAIKAAATLVWGLINAAILGPIRAVRDALTGKDGIWAKIHDTAVAAWDKIKGALGGFATGVKDGILNAIKGGLNLLIGFVNAVIKVINLIPGVPNIKPIAKLAEGGTVSKSGVQALAEGGIVNRPIVMMGEEAPRHPEYVIPTNPAYRKRASMLLGQAANAIGFAQGGILNTQEMSDLWRSKGGGASIADTMGVIGLVESGGNPRALNPSGAAGLWQILGALVPGNLFNPGINALNAIEKYKTQGLSAWDASKDKWGPLIGKTVGPDLSPASLIKMLPGIGDLPDWLKGTGKYLLDKVGDWIKDTVASVVGPGATSEGGLTGTGPSGVGTFEGIPMANWIIGALKHARSRGFTGHPTSGYRTHSQNVAQGRNYRSEHEGIQYPHGAVDFGSFTTGLATKLAAVAATADYKYPLLAPIGFSDDGHASGTGHKMGGILGEGTPFVGSYRNGGTLPADGLYYGHQGETVSPRGQRPSVINIANMNVGSRTDENSWLARLSFKLATAS